MLYGLANSPSMFQAFMNEVFWEYLHRFVIIYIDDILIFSRNELDHHLHVTQVLQKLKENHLYLKLEKCEFHRSSIQFLGYIIDAKAKGIQMDQRKVDAVRNWPIPTSIKGLQRFLGFANFYCSFITNVSTLSAPLTSLRHNMPKSLSWSPAATEAFHQLKQAFTTAPTLIHPNPDLPFIVEVDASTMEE